MRRSLLTIAAACMWFAGTNVMAMGAPVEVAAAAEGDESDCCESRYVHSYKG